MHALNDAIRNQVKFHDSYRQNHLKLRISSNK